ncbi:substrate-binding domain-containing protein [Streptococcus orisratti]|uniref:substrate-binding domain-containing protein n=1 Tax=Streptococcus orisratti TaxID=114652 RepID=UPI002941BF66|nr:substrate-binding domain-containing protein [Streptococcus orisratti]
MKKCKLFSVLTLAGLTALVGLSACGKSNGGSSSTSSSASGNISVVSREDGSGTRGAFVELFGVQEEQNGEKVDLTTDKAIVTNSTSVMLTTVAGDKSAIGYASLGSLDDTVKVLKIDGTEASVANIKAGSYKISRPFNIVTKDKISEAAQDFINFILSSDGQAVVEENGYIPLDDTKAYQSSVDSGKIVVSGSSSVTPVMEKLKEAYSKVNSKVEVEIQQSDSSTGITNAIEGTADIGMASRDLKDEETSKGVSSTVIAMDGIAVIVNKDNKVDGLTSEQVKTIFTGKTTSWDGLSD